VELSLFSISYAGFWGQDRLDLPAFIAKAADLGFASVMLAGKRPHVSPLDMRDEQLRKLKDTLDRHGVRCAVIAAYTELGGTGAAEVPSLEWQVAYVESLARIGSKLGAKVVRVFTAYESAGKSAGVLWRQVVSTLQEMSSRAADHDVTLAIQNHHDLAVHTDSLLELLHDVNRSNCRLGFDAWSPALRGEDLHTAARKAAPFTAITTNADYVRLPRFVYQPELINYTPVQPDFVRAVPFGEGFIDYAAFFSGLCDGGFNGIATYEMCSPIRGGGAVDNLDRFATRYATWMIENGFAAAR
jgi:sugar phosphate isomerase/epimerase